MSSSIQVMITSSLINEASYLGPRAHAPVGPFCMKHDNAWPVLIHDGVSSTLDLDPMVIRLTCQSLYKDRSFQALIRACNQRIESSMSCKGTLDAEPYRINLHTIYGLGVCRCFKITIQLIHRLIRLN